MALLENFWRPWWGVERDWGRPRGWRALPRLAYQRADWPPLNVWETDDALEVEVEVPGVRRDDIELEVLRDEVTIRGRRELPEGRDANGYHRRERPVGGFARRLRLPVAVDADKVDANLADGVLRIVLPKHEAALARKIQVTGA